MSLASDLRMYARFTRGLAGFLRRRISVEEARAMLRERLARREDSFLRLVERGIYGYPRSPYLPLLEVAGCQFGDLRNMVRADGLDATLQKLREAGVYVTFEEFKGREPIVRGGRTIPVQARDFDNPYLSTSYYARSGGTTGAGTRVPIDLDHIVENSSQDLLTYAAHGLLGVPTATTYGAFPDGFGTLLIRIPSGQIPRRWFSPIAGRDFHVPLRQRAATEYVLLLARLMGTRLPRPELVRFDQAAVVARWVAATLKTEGRCLVRGHVSTAVRVVVAAESEGLDMTGAVFMGGGEPPTPAKVREITRRHARWIPNYVFTEAGRVGTGCARPLDPTDVHFMRDTLALIQHPRQAPGTDIMVDAFHFTTLSPKAPKLLLNVESDDYGVLERRSCGCPFDELGLTDHIRQIYSFRKLTGEGVTLIGSEMTRILEEVLPARLGGSPLDYQLLEEEDERGLTKLSLVISPRIAIADERSVIEIVQRALAEGGMAADSAQAVWREAQTLRVKRMEPIGTARGKLMPLHLLRNAAAAAGVRKDG
jgi:hypothetical protein